jgi:hypothetical protein
MLWFITQGAQPMTIIIEPYLIPEKGTVDLKIERSFDIKVTAEEARRQVNRWLLNEVSYLIGADSPTLVIGERLVVWRVPAWLGFPHTGRVGIVGSVDVDVTTGAMTNTPTCKADIERRAEELAVRQPPYQPRGAAPPEYTAKDLPPTPTVHIHDDGRLTIVAADEA